MDRHPLILSMDTATPCSAVALTSGTRKDGSVVASLSLTGKVTHSRRLLKAVDYLLQEAGLSWPQIDGIGVSLGPGSFTGLRIGMATAKGLAAAAGKALIGIPSLDSLAAKCSTSRLICALIDARKKEVYTALYRCTAEGLVERVGDIKAIAPEELGGLITEPVLMIGDGAVLYADLIKEMFGELVLFAPAMLHELSAASLGMLAGEKLVAGEVLDVAEAEPLYIRSSDAELNLAHKKNARAILTSQ